MPLNTGYTSFGQPDGLSAEIHSLCFKNVSKSASVGGNMTCIVNSCVGAVSSGEMLGIMGLARSGKTSLLNILAGRDVNYSGEVLLDGVDISRFKDSPDLGYVMQFDIFFEDLSTEEILIYAALLRSPEKAQRGDLKSLVGSVMETLHLTAVANAKAAVLSYTQRKSLALGVELLGQPKILLVDEPTTFLDSSSGAGFMLTLRRLAGPHRVSGGAASASPPGIGVITVLQNPSTYAFYSLDKAIFMHEGGMAYYGRASECMAYLKRVGYTLPKYPDDQGGLDSLAYNPADFFLELLSSLDVQTAAPPDAQGSSGINSKFNPAYVGWRPRYILATVFEADKALAAVNTHIMSLRMTTTPATRDIEFWAEVALLISRSYHCSMRGEFMSTIKLIEAVIVAIIAGSIWMQTKVSEDTIYSSAGCILFLVIFWYFSALFAGASCFFFEKHALEREYKAGTYRLSSFVLGRAIGTLPSRVLLPTLFVLVCYPIAFSPSVWSTGTGVGNVIGMIFVIILTISSCDALALLIAGACSLLTTAISVTNGVSMCGLLLGAFYTKKEWSGVTWAKSFSVLRYSYDACANLQFEISSTYECNSGNLFLSCIPSTPGYTGTVSSEEVLDLLAINSHTVGQNIGYVVLFTIVFYILAYLVLLYKFSKSW